MKTVGVLMVMLVLLAGCGTKGIPVTTTKTSGAPAWIDNEIFSAEQITAVGIARKNPLNDKSMQRSEALADARTKMAQKISGRSQSVYSQLNRHQTEAGNARGGKKLTATDVASKTTEETRRVVTDLVMYGTTPEEFWTDPEDGNLYVLVVMDPERSARAFAIADPNSRRKELDQGSGALKEEMRHMEETIKSQKE